MLVDNHSTDFKVHSFIQQYINDGSMDIVTGYFTVGALCHFGYNGQKCCFFWVHSF